ncbi:MAG: dihydroorotase [Rhodocyclaceae bacterium]|nr:dihydroorotase [Rhodocyclaceae bacterium]
MQTLTLARPDDWHLHLRDGAALAVVVPHTARQFARAIVMPNPPPVTTTAQAAAYRERILAAVPQGADFRSAHDAVPDRQHAAGRNRSRQGLGVQVDAVKYYPAGATTNSAAGVTAIEQCFATLARMEEAGLPLLVHGEVTDAEVDIFDRERVFIERVLAPLLQRFPRLRLVLEHITTLEGVQFVASMGPNVAGTLTAHHLLLNRNALLAGGVRPHHYCLPVLKRESHRQALLKAATSGSPKFFLGTDSAPHARSAKEAALRLRRLLYGAACPRTLCRGLRGGGCARQAGVLCQLPRRRFLRPAAQYGQGRAGEGRMARTRQPALR